MKNQDTSIHCSFCGQSVANVEKLVWGGTDNSCICDKCVEIACNLLSDIPKGDIAQKSTTLLPQKVKEYLDNYIIGQEDTKITLSVAIYNHYKRVIHNIKNKKYNNDIEIQKSNILLVGPTGTGKTLFAQTLAKMLDVPFIIADATTMTQAGYVGEDVDVMISNLCASTGYNVEKTEMGIIYCDEFCKLARVDESSTVSRDVSGEGVQQALLKLIEGTEVIVQSKPKGSYGSTPITINTSNILFIFGGAFVGIEKIQKARKTKSKKIGFKDKLEIESQYTCLENDIESSDLIKYGIIPELVGRLPIVCKLDALTEKDLISILKYPKNSIIKQYVKLLGFSDVELSFTEDAYEEIAKMAISRDVGARGIRSILERIMTPIIYNITPNNNKIVINRDVILNTFINTNKERKKHENEK